jgi:hypothetical protein
VRLRQPLEIQLAGAIAANTEGSGSVIACASKFVFDAYVLEKKGRRRVWTRCATRGCRLLQAASSSCHSRAGGHPVL